MTKKEIEAVVLAEYKKRYPKWKKTEVTDIIFDTFGGTLVVVRSTEEDNNENEEMCYIYSEGTIRIFYTTEELVHFLEIKAKAPFLERVFSRQIFTGLIFLFLLVIIFIIGFQDNFKPEALSILGSILGGAGGYFFGAANKSSNK